MTLFNLKLMFSSFLHLLNLYVILDKQDDANHRKRHPMVFVLVCFVTFARHDMHVFLKFTKEICRRK